MKKIAILAACALTGMAAVAQISKESERAIKDAKTYSDYQKAVKNAGELTDAFSNFTAGEGGFKVYDQYLLKEQVNQLPTDEAGILAFKKDRSNSILDGYNYFMAAFPLDSVPDAKGKVKPKYSKKMMDIIVGHVNDFDRAAVDCFQTGNYMGAYDAWDILLEISNSGKYAKSNIRPFNDTVVATIRNNQGRAAFQAKNYEKALTAFKKSIKAVPSDTTAYEFAYESARLGQNKPAMLEVAEAGLKKFGTSNPLFLQLAVNCYIDSENFDGAKALLKQGIDSDPNNGAYYYSYGILNESQKLRDEAKVNYKKAIDLSKIPGAYMQLGRMLAEDYDALDQATGNMSQADYNKYAFETLNPLLKESAGYLEQAYALDHRQTTALMMLKNIYYKLGDNENLQRVTELYQNAD